MSYRLGQAIKHPFFVADINGDPATGLIGQMEPSLVRSGAAAVEAVIISETGEGWYLFEFTPVGAISGSGFVVYGGRAYLGSAQPYTVFEHTWPVYPSGAGADEPWDGIGLCTLEQVHQAMKLPLTSTGKDEMITLLIQACSEWIAQYLDFDFADHTADATEDVYDGNGGNMLALHRRPIAGVDSVVIDGAEIDEAEEVSDAGWILDGNILVLRGQTFSRGIRNVVVTTRWGYSSIPKLYQFACVKLVRYKLDDLTEHPNETYQMEAQNQHRWLPDSMPADVREMLDGARRMSAV